jgi:hypothetical protein
MTVTIADVEFTHDTMKAALSDGRKISVPLSWFPRLQNAEAGQLQDWRTSAAGEGIHWPQLDEDVGLAGLLRSEEPVLRR